MIELPAGRVAFIERGARDLRKWWAKYGSLGQHLRIKAELAAQTTVSPIVDVDLSRELAAKTKSGPRCYWNAAAAIVRGDVPPSACYVEGVVAAPSRLWWSKGHAVRGIELHLEGWVEFEGRVVDPTAYHALADLGDEAALPHAIYLPCLRADREEIGDDWDELPFTMQDEGALTLTLDRLATVLACYTERIRKARAIVGARRWAPPVARR